MITYSLDWRGTATVTWSMSPEEAVQLAGYLAMEVPDPGVQGDMAELERVGTEALVAQARRR